eukprot:TRINITY_DN1284_c1_g1_i1.p1 TRINITY_DN1284_c1_g1~~TRINITY_DN1284_c1_g1_i1.p1  ORF type:complete len:249 (+),score=59.80 TRINITY_DN1284_c1_g1_i1:89-835(+)
MSGTRDENVFMARLSEQAERYEDMVEYMKRVAAMGAELSLDERNLLSVAYKNSVTSRRQAWRAVKTVQSREAQGTPIVALIGGYRESIERELNERCNDILELLANTLIPKASTAEAKVFYMKMSGDYFRYLAEFSADESHKQKAHDSYQAASEAAAELPATNPIRLGLALNFSVFYYEVLASGDKACQLAKSAFESAMADLDSASADEFKDSEQILQLLRDNLTLWTSDAVQTGEGRAEQDGTAVEEM